MVDMNSKSRNQVFSHANQFFKISKRLIELTCRIFGIVGRIKAFISERRSNLENTVHATKHKALKPYFRRNPQRQCLISEFCCPGYKRSCDGTSSAISENWGLNLKKFVVDEKVSQVLNYA